MFACAIILHTIYFPIYFFMKLPIALNDSMSRVFSLFAYVGLTRDEAEQTHVKPDNLKPFYGRILKQWKTVYQFD